MELQEFLSRIAFPPSLKRASLIISARALIMVEEAARRPRNTVNSVQRIMGQQTLITPMSQ
jgi:hypothetical protein